MDAASLNILVALAAGALSFVSPCVLPLVPAYLSYVSGVSIEDMADDRSGAGRSRVLTSAVAFVLGLATVLSLFGLGVSVIGQALGDYQGLMTRLGGALVIVFGLHMAGLIRIPILYRERRLNFLRFGGNGAIGAFLMGGAFGIGWTPCVGVILASILTLASQSETVVQGTALLFAYSLGLGVPFILAALGIRRAFRVMGLMKERMRLVELASGAMLIVMGVLLFTDRMLMLSTWFTQMFGTGLAL